MGLEEWTLPSIVGFTEEGDGGEDGSTKTDLGIIVETLASKRTRRLLYILISLGA